MEPSPDVGKTRNGTKRRAKKQYYLHAAKQAKKDFVLKPGVRGFICTCNKYEKECVREAYNLLNEYMDIEEIEQTNDDNEMDILDSMDIEIADLKNQALEKKKQRFQAVKSGVNNCVFIRTNIENPIELHHKIFTDIHEKQQQKTRYILRLIPVGVTCKATIEEMKKTAKEYFQNFFKNEGKTFQINIKIRNNSALKSSNVLQPMLNIIRNMNSNNKSQFLDPHYYILIEILKHICCFSVCTDYFKFFRFNILDAATKKEATKKKKLVARSTTVKTTDQVSSAVNVEPSDTEMIPFNADINTTIKEENIVDANIEEVNSDENIGVTIKEENMDIPVYVQTANNGKQNVASDANLTIKEEKGISTVDIERENADETTEQIIEGDVGGLVPGLPDAAVETANSEDGNVAIKEEMIEPLQTDNIDDNIITCDENVAIKEEK